ncbi:MAG: FkbM family methyltransferase [Candidatus Acidiferrales bacterium]
MRGARQWAASLLLHTPAGLRLLRQVPLLGAMIHGISRRILPADELVWAHVTEGPGRGIWLELSPRTGRNYLLGGVEHPVQATIAARLQAGDVFYDLGANIGFYSLLAARCIGPQGKIFSFEPDSTTAERLRRNVARNGFANINVVEAGVWSASGTLQFSPADDSSPDRGVGTFVGADATAGKAVRTVALDDFALGAAPPDAIKCDVEGAEVEVFRGAEKLLRAHHPWILCEIHSQENGCALREFLSGFGYTFEIVDPSHILAVHESDPPDAGPLRKGGE